MMDLSLKMVSGCSTFNAAFQEVRPDLFGGAIVAIALTPTSSVFSLTPPHLSLAIAPQ